MPTLMTEEEIKNWILRRMGGQFFKVEVSKEMLDDAVEYAKRWFAAKKGVRKNALVPFFSGVNQYNLDDYENRAIDIVLDVVFPVPAMDISLVFSPYILQDEKVPYDVFAAPSAAGLYSSYEQVVQYVNQAKRILNAEPDWRQDNRDLFIFPNPKTNGNMRVEYKTHIFTVEQLPERDHDFIKRYALMFVKKDLIQVRGKYEDFPGAQGSTRLNTAQLNADVMKEEAALEREIIQSAYPMGHLIG